ncbi:hypothetical protein JTE90_011327 [Oedothorax gibbosus]|uniref:Proton-coupled folate transporter n=1 Tax=Oedothorax gibbosus TaxID=931172 RepID=A0AAV6VKK3_9ARAC|nr:hypothetical protein JTE90_011327 [Oedothorax gibbosus]
MSSTNKNDSEDTQNLELQQPAKILNASQTENNPSSVKHQDVFTYTASNAIEFFAFIKTLKIEAVMFMLMFATLMRIVSATTLIMDKVCLVHLNFAEDVCRDLASHPKQKIEVEILSNNYIVGHNLIQMLPACIVTVFIGAWSDIYGRKVPLVISMAGLALEGGLISGSSITYSYITDISTTRQRTFKYALIELVSGLSYPLGQLSGGWAYKFTGYVSVFLLSACGNLLTLAFIVFVLKETRGLDSTDSWSVKLKSLFSLKSVIEGMKATVKSRPNKGRTKMFLLILGLTMTVLSYSSISNINFLYVHHQFDWDNTQYSTVSSAFSIVGIFMMFFAVPVFRHFKLGDAPLGITGNVSLLAKNITIGLAHHPGLYYLGQTFGLLQSLGSLAARSSIAKVASKDDIGKVFSFISSAESLIHVMNAAVVSQLFNATLNLYPGMVFFGAGGLLFIPISVFIWIGRQPSVDYENLERNLQEDSATESQTDRPNTIRKPYLN